MTDKKKLSLTKGQKIKLIIALLFLLITASMFISSSFNKKQVIKPNPADDIMQMDTSDIRPSLSQQSDVTPEPEISLSQKKSKPVQFAKKTKPNDVIHLDNDATNLVHYSTQLKLQTLRQKALEAQINADKTALEKAESEKYSSQPILKNAYTLPPVPNEKEINFGVSSYNPSLIDDMRVASLVSVGNKIEAVISFQNQYIPIKVGSKIGDIGIVKITPNSVTFKENGKNRTKWVATVPVQTRANEGE